MPITISEKKFDTMKEACARLDIARQTMLRYITEGYFSEPPCKKQGKGKAVRYFPEEWYTINEMKLNNDRG